MLIVIKLKTIFGKNVVRRNYTLMKEQQVSSVVEISPHDPKVVGSNLKRACDRFPELIIISIPSDASHLHWVKPVTHGS